MLSRNLLRLSKISQIFTTHKQRVFTLNLSQVECSEEKKSVTQKFNEKKLLEELSTPYPTKILVHLENNQQYLNGNHILVAMKSFLKSYKQIASEATKNETSNFMKQTTFRELCTVVKANITKLSGSQAVEALDILNRMKLDNPNVLDALLKYILKCVHELSIEDFRILSTVLQKVPQTYLVRQAQLVSSQKFVLKLSSALENNEIGPLSHALSFLTYNIKNRSLLEKVLDKLCNYNDKIPLGVAVELFESICNLSYSSTNAFTVFFKAQNAILQNIDLLNKNQVIYIIRLIDEKIKISRSAAYYDPRFLDEVIKRVISDDMGFETALSVLKCISRIRHLNKDILNYACATYFEKKNFSEKSIEDEASKLLVLISALAMARHKTIFWDEIEQYLRSNIDLILNNSYETLCILSANLISLDLYLEKLLSKVFQDKFNYSKDPFLHWTFGRIYQMLNEKKSYNGPMPTERQLKSLEILQQNTMNKIKKNPSELERRLVTELGMSECVKSHLTTKLLHIIELAAAFQDDGKPVPINSTSKKINYLEDITVPPGCKLVVFFLIPEFWHFRNVNQMLGTHIIKLDSFENFVRPIFIFRHKWNALEGIERTQFLMSKVKEAL